MRTNILLSISFLLAGLLLGFKLFYKEQVEQPKLEISQVQEQVQKCKATITKRENKDGSKDEITEFLVESSQKQSQQVAIETKKIKKNTVGLFQDGLHYNRKIYEDINLLGFEFDVGASMHANKDKASFGISVDF